MKHIIFCGENGKETPIHGDITILSANTYSLGRRGTIVREPLFIAPDPEDPPDDFVDPPGEPEEIVADDNDDYKRDSWDNDLFAEDDEE